MESNIKARQEKADKIQRSIDATIFNIELADELIEEATELKKVLKLKNGKRYKTVKTLQDQLKIELEKQE